jgi:regulatory protein
MHIVTQLAPTRRRAGFVDVFVDGVEVGAIANEDAIRLRLTTGEAVDDAMLDEVSSLSACAGAIQLAERFIAFRPRTIFEVRQRLRRANIDVDSVEATIERLVARGLLDDKRFADIWIENRTAFSPRAPRLLQAELRRKGVDRASIDEVLEATIESDEVILATNAGRARLHRYLQTDWQSFERSLGGFLNRRGFNHDAVRRALETLWAERHID